MDRQTSQYRLFGASYTACPTLVFWRHRVAFFVIFVSLGFQSLTLAAPPEVPLSYFASGSPASQNPFVWEPARPNAPFLPPVSQQATGLADFLRIALAPTASPMLPQVSPSEPWLPGDLDPIAPPDGMPVRGNPAGLALLENAVGNGIVVGEVSDATSLDPIPGALIELVGTGRTAEADAKGRFEFAGLPAGTFNIEASQLGYFTDTTVVTVVEGSPSEIRFGLRARPTDDTVDETTLEEETIVGEYQGDSAGDFNLSLEIDSPAAITSSIGREEFAKTGVSDAGEAITKVSGANIVDGKYAVVRGLADRYVTTTFNGAQIASADPSRKAVQLDLFPTSVIEAIKVDKTYSPQLSGDFGGGAIDIITRSFPEERIFQISSKVNYNDSLEDRIYTHPNRELGLFGDIGEDMPSSLEGQNPDGSILFYDGGNQTPDQLSDRFKELHASQNLRPKETDSQLGSSSSLTFGETFELPNEMKLGVMTAFSQSTGDTSNSTPISNQTRDYYKDEFSRGVEWAAYLSTGLQLNEYNTIQAIYFKKHIAQDDVSNSYDIIDDEENLNYGRHLQNSNVNPGNTYGPDAIYYGASWDINPLERDLDIFQLKGSHSVGERGIRLDWALTDSFAVESRPHSSHFEYGILDFTTAALAGVIANSQKELDAQAIVYAQLLSLPNPETYNWVTIEQPMIDNGYESIYDEFEKTRSPVIDDERGRIDTSAHGSNSGSVPGKQRITRRSEKSEEDAYHSQIGTTLPYFFSEADDRFFEFGIGASSLSKIRTTTARQYDLVLALNSSTTPGFPPGDLDGPGGLGELIAADPSILDQYFNGTYDNGPYYVNALTLNGLENIRTELEQFSHYYSGLLQFGKSFVSGGVRFEEESYKIDIDSAPLSAFTEDQISANGWESRDTQKSMLPSVNAGTTVFDDVLGYQFSWSKTVARPTFWEFIPSQTLDQSSGLARRGNNTLGQTELDNFDLAITWKPSETTSIRTSLFHKNLVRPLVNFYDNGTLVYADSNINSDTEEVEDFTATLNGIEVEAEVADLGPFNLKGNFTYIDAELEYFTNVGGVSQAVTSKLPYQPTYIANLTLGYEYEPWDLNANLIYNYNGDYPVILKLRPEDREVTRESIYTLDLIVSKIIETEDVIYTYKAGIKNILNAVDTFVYDDGIYNSDAAGRGFFAEIQMSF